MSTDVMRAPEFHAWSLERFGLPLFVGTGPGPAFRAAWAQEHELMDRGRTGTGTGHPAEYGPVQRRRVACYARMRPHVGVWHLRPWILLAGEHADGYLLDDGSGVRWVPDLEPVRDAIARGLGVGVVPCGE